MGEEYLSMDKKWSGSKKNGAGRLPPQEWNALSDADKARIKKERSDQKAAEDAAAE